MRFPVYLLSQLAIGSTKNKLENESLPEANSNSYREKASNKI